MAVNNCKDFLKHLETWTGSERPADAQSHLRDCRGCRTLVEDMSAIRAEARAWGVHEPEPHERVWTLLRAQLEREGLIRSSEAERAIPAVLPAHDNWLSGLFARISRPALAGAYLSILVALGFALGGPLNKQTNQARWLEGTQVATSPLSAKLNTFEQTPMIPSSRDLNPAVTASLRQNLAIVDNYILLCEKSVQEEPQNEVARDYLYEAYQQKADLLAQIGERGENVQ
jgi:hypothetical protein